MQQSQMAVEMLERAAGQQGAGGERVGTKGKDMGSMRGGSATGGSYATTTDDTDWADREVSCYSYPSVKRYSADVDQNSTCSVR